MKWEEGRKQRRVLILVENLPSPFDRRVWQEATTLRDAGYVVSIICPTGKGYDKKHEVIDGIHLFRYSLPTEGEGALAYEMKALARELGVAEYVTFTGRVLDAELLAMLNTADVCVNQDVANDMNDISTMNKIMEYMALGKPMVQFDLTEGRYSAQQASLYARRNDPFDFALKIVELLTTRRSGPPWALSAAAASSASWSGATRRQSCSRPTSRCGRAPAARARSMPCEIEMASTSRSGSTALRLDQSIERTSLTSLNLGCSCLRPMQTGMAAQRPLRVLMFGPALTVRGGVSAVEPRKCRRSLWPRAHTFTASRNAELGFGHWNELGHRAAGEIIAQKLCAQPF